MGRLNTYYGEGVYHPKQAREDLADYFRNNHGKPLDAAHWQALLGHWETTLALTPTEVDPTGVGNPLIMQMMLPRILSQKEALAGLSAEDLHKEYDKYKARIAKAESEVARLKPEGKSGSQKGFEEAQLDLGSLRAENPYLESLRRVEQTCA